LDGSNIAWTVVVGQTYKWLLGSAENNMGPPIHTDQLSQLSLQMSTDKYEPQHFEAPSFVPTLDQSNVLTGPNGITYVPGSDAEKRLLRKMDMHLVPVVWFMYVMSYLDRANIGNAKVSPPTSPNPTRYMLTWRSISRQEEWRRTFT
jgi:hypothetical protein